MVILALETATRAGSLAVWTAPGSGSATTGDPSRTHGVRLPEEILAFLRAARLTLADVDSLAVVTGPGSFTGLRVGLATVQGLALARGCPVVGVPTLEAMASGWLDAHPDHDGWLVCCLDGARDEVFYAVHDVTGAADVEAAREALAPRVAAPGVAAAEVASMCAGRPVVVVGDGAERYAAAWRELLPQAAIESTMPNLAAAAARLAVRRQDRAAAPHALRPFYVRRPDAVLARERASQARGHGDTARAAGSAPAEALEVYEAHAVEDLARVAALQAEAFGRAWESGALAGGGANSNATPRVYVARRSAGEIVAYCATWQILDELHINSIAVDERYRRHGLGTELMRQVLGRAREAGARSATLEVRGTNRAGRALYERLGFAVEGVRHGYYEHPADDALVLWRRDLGGVRG